MKEYCFHVNLFVILVSGVIHNQFDSLKMMNACHSVFDSSCDSLFPEYSTICFI